VPPTRFWGSQGEEWGPTDLIAAQALTLVEDAKCPCGCGGWTDECLDPDLQDMWSPHIGTHYRKAALEQAKKDHKAELEEPGTYVYLRDDRLPAPDAG